MTASAQRSQYLDPRPEALDRIDHVVVLMLENRSFDNLLGWLYADGDPPRDGQHYEGLTESLFNPMNNIDANGNPFVEKVHVRRNGAPFRIGGRKVEAEVDFSLPSPDPGEGYRDATHQLFGEYRVDDLYPPEPTALGYVENYKNAMLYGTYSFHDAPTDPRAIMNCYTPEQTPVLSTLARQFAVCDQYYCSVPSQTLPNRDFVHAATSTGFVNNKPQNVCDAKTIYNQIQDAIDGGRKDLSWAIYGGTQKDRDTKQWHPFSLTRICMKQIQDERFDDNFRLMDAFFEHAAAGTLPSYCFLEPQLSGVLQNDQHPPADIRPGERLIADVYEALRDSPSWERTLLVITYDEHGGCYDHHPPTARAETPDATSVDGQMGFRFNRFGVRVPTVLVSPWIEAGTIARPSGWTPFDHTSVIKTGRNACGLADSGPLTKRDEAAPDLSCVLTRSEPRTDKPKVTPLPYPVGAATKVNDLHRLAAEMLAEKTGTNAPSDAEITDFIHSAYFQAFHAGKEDAS